MQQPRVGALIVAVLGLSFLGLTPMAMCQFGLGSYALSHPFGLSTATTCRQFGMGAPISCVWDRGSGNPAFAATQTDDSVGLRWSDTSFDSGLSVDSYHLWAMTPLRPNETGLAFTLFRLHSTGGVVAGNAVDISEDDLAIHYGRRIAKRWTAGIGLSPWSVVTFTATLPNGATAMNLTERPKIGARTGLTYETAPGDYVGVVYDYMLEDVSGSGLAFLPAGHAEQVFHTDLLALGASRHITPEWLVAAEWQNATSYAGNNGAGMHGWHLGTEYRWPQGWALRAGLNDGQMTLGAGYQNDHWEAEYAYANNWNNDVVGAVLGTSSTNQLQLLYCW